VLTALYSPECVEGEFCELRLAVEDALDLNVLRASREREKQERDEVGKKLDDVNRYLREAFSLEDDDDDDHVDDDDDDEDQEGR
jgi:hypothetical protein